MGIGSESSFGQYVGESRTWLLALLLLQVATEYFVFTYKSTWATTSTWANEWGDYYSYWGHHMTTISLLQILFPSIFQFSFLKHIDFVKITLVALTNTTVLWQGPRLGRYLLPEHWDYTFFINSLQHGGNLLCLAMYVWRSKRSLRAFNLWHTLMLPLAYTTFVMWRVSSGRSTMRYYLPEGMGTPSYTFLVGAMFITLQFVTELVTLQLVMNLNRVPDFANRIYKATATIRSHLLSPDENIRSMREIINQVLNKEN